MELSGRNEGDPHLMSLEIAKSGKPSRSADGEGCHAASSNRQLGAVDSGGVSEDDTTGRTTKISWESSPRGTATSQLPVQGGNPAKAGQARGAVGVLRSSDEPAYSKGAGEQREGTWVNATGNRRGWGWPGNRILTPKKLRSDHGRSGGCRKASSEWPSESCMRENRLYSSMRGGTGIGY